MKIVGLPVPDAVIKTSFVTYKTKPNLSPGLLQAKT